MHTYRYMRERKREKMRAWIHRMIQLKLSKDVIEHREIRLKGYRKDFLLYYGYKLKLFEMH